MSGLVVTFLALGGSPLLLLVLRMTGGPLPLGPLHIGHLHLHAGPAHLPLGHGHGADLSLPVISGFLGAFGFAGAAAATLAGGHGTAALLIATVVGLLAAVPTAFLAGKLVDAAMNI